MSFRMVLRTYHHIGSRSCQSFPMISMCSFTGIGVRVSFYIQHIRTIVMSLYYPSSVRLMQIRSNFTAEETESFLQNAFLTSISFIPSTIMYVFKPGAFSILDGLLLPIIFGGPPYVDAIRGRADDSEHVEQLEGCFGSHQDASDEDMNMRAGISTYGFAPGCNANSTAKFIVLGYTVITHG